MSLVGLGEIVNDINLNAAVDNGEYLEINGANIQFNRLEPGKYSRSTLLADNTLVDGTERTIGQGVPVAGNELSFVVSSRIITVASTSGNDTSAGTGMRSINISGLNSNGLFQNEVVVMNGQTPVNTSLSYTRTIDVVGITAGSSNTNEGIIYVSDNTDTFVSGVPQNRLYSIMDIGHSFAKVGLTSFSGGVNTNIIMDRIIVHTTATEAKPVVINIYKTLREFDETSNMEILSETFYLSTQFSGDFSLDRRITGVDDIRVTARLAGGGGTVSVSIKIFFIIQNN